MRVPQWLTDMEDPKILEATLREISSPRVVRKPNPRSSQRGGYVHRKMNSPSETPKKEVTDG